MLAEIDAQAKLERRSRASMLLTCWAERKQHADSPAEIGLARPLAPPRTEARPKTHDRPAKRLLARPAKGETCIASAINSPAEAQRVVAQVAATRRFHDPKTCRNRYCLVCAAMKEKP